MKAYVKKISSNISFITNKINKFENGNKLENVNKIINCSSQNMMTKGAKRRKGKHN